MKTQRQPKAVADSDKPKTTKKARRSAAKSSFEPNGKSLLATYEYAPIGIIECSPDGKHINVNEEFCRLLGYEKADLLGKSLKDITHEDDYPLEINLHQQLVEGKIPFYRLEKRYTPKHGGTIWTELTRSLIRDASGKPLYTIGVVLDISDRKHVERVLRDSAERLRLATETARMFTWELDVKTQIYTVADNFERVLGFSAGLMPKNNFDMVLRLCPPEDAQAILAAISTAIDRRGDLHALQYRIVNPEDGQVTWLESNAKIVYDEEGKPDRIFGVAQNITERKLNEYSLAESARQQEALYQLTDQLHRTNSLEDVFNASLDAILGALQCDRASILLYDHTNVMHFVAWRGLSEAYRKAIDGHSPWKPDAINPVPICLNDVRTADLSDSLRATVQKEGIGALAFIPLVVNGRLIGKFMTYYNAPHSFTEDEVELSLTIAHQLAASIDRKRAEVQLRESEERYRTIVDTSSEGIWYVDLNGETIYLNEPMADILGYTVDEILGHTVTEFCFVEDISNARDRIRSNYQGNYEHFDFRFRHKDGGEVLVLASTSPVRDGAGKVIGVLGMFVDITERKYAEHQLRQTASFDEAVMGSMGEGLYTVDRDGKVMSMNPAAEKMFGWTLNEIVGRRMHDVTHYKHPDGTPFPAEECAGFQVLKHGHKLVGYEDVFIRKDGTFFDVMYSSSPLWDNGKIDGLVVVFSDITTRKQVEKRLVLLSEISELVRKSEDANDLLYSVSEAVGDYLQVKRCLFNEIDVEKDLEIVHRDYCRGVESVAGLHKLSDYSSVTSAEMKAGKTVVNYDSKLDPRTASDYERSYVQYGERAYITVPLMRENRWVASLWMSDNVPRQWSSEDVSLLETIAERTWIAVEKLRINAALRASETLYRTIARSIPGGGIYVVDKDMRYLVADGAVTEAFGLSREMLEGHTVSEVFSGAQRARMIERLNRNFAGETVSYETEHNGRVYWTQQAPLYDSIGQTIIVTLDITERKQMDEALRQSEERFVQFMEHLPGLAWIKDMQGRYVYANAAAENAFNTPREKLYGKTDQDIFPPNIATQFKANDELALLDEKGVQVIEMLQHSDGVLHYSLVNKFPIPGLDGNITLVGGTAFDITERKRAEEALHDSEERLSAILRQATAGIVRKDAEGRLVFVNQAFCNMLGYTESDLLGQTVWDFMYQDDVSENKRSFDRLMDEGIPFKLERRFLRHDGSIIWVDASVSPVIDATGKPQSAVAVEVDITARKQAEEALQQINLQLETRVQERTAELQAMNRSLQDEIHERRQVELALAENRRRLQILTQRLVEVQEEERRAIARELHDRVGQTLSALNINLIIMRGQMLPDSLERVGPRFDDSMQLVGETITLVRDVMSNLRPAVLDDYGLEAALQSHIDEFKSRYEIQILFEKRAQPIPRLGPSIEMTFLRIAQEALMNIARHANASQVILSLWQESDSICMTIEDNGSGIVSRQEANRPGSHGLTIMRERAEAFGGTLKVDSVPGQGTKIEMSIPIRKGSQSEGLKEASE